MVWVPAGSQPREAEARQVAGAETETDLQLQSTGAVGASGVLTPYKSVAIPEGFGRTVVFDRAGRVLVEGLDAVFVYNSSGLYVGRLDFPKPLYGLAAAGDWVFVSTATSVVGEEVTYRLDARTLEVQATYPERWIFPEPMPTGDLLHFWRDRGAFGTLRLSTGTVTYWSGPQVGFRAIPNSSRALLFGDAIGLAEYDLGVVPPAPVTTVTSSLTNVHGSAPTARATTCAIPTPGRSSVGRCR